MPAARHHQKSSNRSDPLTARVQLEAMQEAGMEAVVAVVLQMRMHVHERTTSY